MGNFWISFLRSNIVNLVEILDENLIKVPLTGKTKDEILEELVQTLAKGKDLSSFD